MSTSPNLIGWKVRRLTSSVASVRYRALLPMIALEKSQVKNRLFAPSLTSNLDGLDTLVIVKSLTAEDLYLVQQASSRNIRVVFDLCDNIFIENYGGNAGHESLLRMFDAISALVDVFVITTEPLAAIVRQRVPNALVTVIPDGIETPALLIEMERLMREAVALEKRSRVKFLYRKLCNLLIRLKQEGPSLVWRLVRRVVFRGQRSLRTHLRRWITHVPNKTRTQSVFLQPSKRVLHTENIQLSKGALHSKTILWFGNHGAEYARFGMLDLIEIQQALEAVALEFDVELVVISNSRSKYDEHIQPLCIPSRYVEWSPKAVEDWLQKSDAVVLPNTLDPFSVCKSANRSVLAVSHGVPVVATSTPALAPLAPYIHTGDALIGLRRYLGNREEGRADAVAAYALAQICFGQEATAKAWMAVLSQPRKTHIVDTPARCILVLNLIQDLDLALPVLDVWLGDGFPIQVWCSASLVTKSPRVLATLQTRRIPYRVLSDDLPLGSYSVPSCASALLTVTETNLGPHSFARKLSEWALNQGLTVATMQHGFENVGLTYEDSVHPIDRITIKAQRIYIWGGVETLHPRLDVSVRARCVPVGCPKPAFVTPADLGPLLPKVGPVVGIFENLHWHRYDETYKKAFLDAVIFLAYRFPEVTFLVKPHHAGVWLTHRYKGDLPIAENIVIADPRAPAWESFTASSLLGHMTAVITSPSTVALDAARYGLPVAVFAGGLDLTNYKPLSLLHVQEDWSSFLGAALNSSHRIELVTLSADFVSRVIFTDDGARRIASDISTLTKI